MFYGQEFDKETGLLNFSYRMFDARIGRFFAVDPLYSGYPHYSPYLFAGNKPILFIDYLGLSEGKINWYVVGKGTVGLISGVSGTVVGIPLVLG